MLICDRLFVCAIVRPAIVRPAIVWEDYAVAERQCFRLITKVSIFTIMKSILRVYGAKWKAIRGRMQRKVSGKQVSRNRAGSYLAKRCTVSGQSDKLLASLTALMAIEVDETFESVNLTAAINLR